MKSGTGEGVLALVKLEEHSNTVSSNMFFGVHSPWTLTRDLGFKLLLLDMALS